MNIRNVNEKRLMMVFEPTFENADLARKAVVGICRDIGTKAFVEDLSLALTESINNAVERTTAKRIEMEITHHAGIIKLRFMSGGDELISLLDAASSVSRDEDEFPEASYGVAIINRLFDSVRTESVDGKAVLTLEMKIINAEMEEYDGD